MVRYTITELFDRKLLWAFLVVTIISMLLVFYTSSIEVNLGGNSGSELSEFGKPMAAEFIVGLSNFLAFMVFLVVMGTAGLIPSMLSKGRVDFFISKPFGRASLFSYKFFSMFIVYSVLVLLCGSLMWLAMGISYIGFSLSVLYLFLFHLMSLLVWLSITSFVGVLTGSFALSMMAAFVVWVVHSIVSKVRLIGDVVGSKTAKYLLDIVYQIFPKNAEFTTLGERLAADQFVASYAALWSSLAFAVVLFFAAIYVFKRKNY